MIRTALGKLRKWIFPHADSHAPGAGDDLSADFALIAHPHSGTTNGIKLSQANTHESADTDAATSSLHHTIGTSATQAAAGNHVHAVIVLQDQKTKGSDGGTFTAGTQTRVLNTEVLDTGNNCVLSSNQFTLAAGTYVGIAIAPAYAVDYHHALIYNTTDASVVSIGSSEYSQHAGGNSNHSTVVFGFAIADGKALELRHYCATTETNNGFGVNNNVTTEVYSQVILLKIA